jgi:hypothetical protein
MPKKGEKQIQGKLDHKIVLRGILANKKKKEIAVEAGSKANSPEARIHAVNKVMNSDRYKRDAKDLVNKLDKEIERLMSAINKKVLLGVSYKDSTSSLEKLVKLRELLTGGVTERTEISDENVKAFLDNA